MNSTAFIRHPRAAIASLSFLFALTLIAFSAVSSDAAELLMFESEGCEWCEAWNEEIGVSYAKTTEAKIVPLRRVDIDDERPADLQHLKGLVYTPTFIVMVDGREAGRIIGYPGEDFFWQLLNEILEKIEPRNGGGA